MSSRGVLLTLALASVAGVLALAIAPGESAARAQTDLHRDHSHSAPAAAPLLPSFDLTRFGPPSSDVVVDRPGLTLTTHHTGEASWEPTIGVTAAGDLYATGWLSFVEPRVLRSTDGGKGWTEVSPGTAAGAPGVSMDPYLFADGDTVFNLDAYALTCGRMSRTDDAGTTWLTNPVACGTVVSDHPSAFAGPPVTSPTVGYPNIIYVCDYRPFGIRSTVYCSKSINGGLSFLPTGDPAFPVGGSDPCTALTGHGVADHKGRIYIPRVTPCGPELAMSADEGATWRLVKIPKGPGTSGDHEASVAVDRRGTIFYMWIGADRLPYLTTSVDGGKTFSKPRMIAPRSVREANAPALTVNEDGDVALSYVGSKNAPALTDESPQPCSNTATECPASEAYAEVTWNGYVAIGRHTSSPAGIRLQTHTINPLDDPIDDEACGPGRCFPIGDFIDITAGPDGTFWAAFVDGCEGKQCVDFYGGELLVVEIRTN